MRPPEKRGICHLSESVDNMPNERQSDPFEARERFETGLGQASLFRLAKLEALGLATIANLPFSIRVLLESVLRNCDGYAVPEEDVKNLAGWNAADAGPGRDSLQAGPRRAARLHRRAGGRRSGGDAGGHEAAGRRSEEDQSAHSGRPGDRSLGAGRLLRQRRRAAIRTSTWNSSAIASATSSCAGARRRSTISASCRRASASCTR